MQESEVKKAELEESKKGRCDSGYSVFPFLCADAHVLKCVNIIGLEITFFV